VKVLCSACIVPEGMTKSVLQHPKMLSNYFFSNFPKQMWEL